MQKTQGIGLAGICMWHFGTQANKASFCPYGMANFLNQDFLKLIIT